MSVDREYKIHIAENRGSAVERFQTAGADLANKKPIDFSGQERPSLESAGLTYPSKSLTGVAAPPDAATHFAGPDRLEPPAPFHAASPASIAEMPEFANTAGGTENSPVSSTKDFYASEFDRAASNALPKDTPANPVNQLTIDAGSLADLVNQARQLHQAFPVESRPAAGQDASDILALIRQLRESFSHYAQAQVTRQELRDELTSLRLLIESKK